MRKVYIIAYDIADAKRWRLVHRSMLGHGDPLQLSVFRCELTELELQILKSELWPVLNLAEDRVMIVNLGPIGGRGDDCIEVWGQPLTKPASRAAIIF